jgi:hypothetical protein
MRKARLTEELLMFRMRATPGFRLALSVASPRPITASCG